MSRQLPLLLAGMLLVAAGPGNERPRLRSPGYLPPMARELLVERMRDHRAIMSGLTWAVVLLDRPAVEELAGDLASAPRLARTDPSAGDLNALLPARFFELQEQLSARARELSAAAKGKDDAALASAYGKLSETCVACHSVYLDPFIGRP
jgi:hypothetical protein